MLQLAYDHDRNWRKAKSYSTIGKEVVLLQSPGVLTAHEPRSGKQVWKFDADCSTIPSATAIKDKIPNDVICSGANSSRVMSDGVLRMGAKAAIANDAGISKHNGAVEGVQILGERGIPAASVSTMSARLGEGLSTWNTGIISVANPVALQRGVKVGMSAKEAARLMMQSV